MLKSDYPLKELNTFSIDVNTKHFIEVFSEEDVAQLISSGKLINPVFILGGGSNVLFTKDFDGTVIKNTIKGIKIINETDGTVIIESGAGVVWDDLVKYCVERNYGGIENMSMIPGSVGAAPIQNIGAYGQELSDSFESLNAIEFSSGNIKTFSKDECKFSYRSSTFKEELKNKYIITKVRVRLSELPNINLNYESLKSKMEELNFSSPSIKDVRNAVIEIRNSKLPDPKNLANAGSFFKNPVISKDQYAKLKIDYPDLVSFTSIEEKMKIAAGWLIESCGWKGKRVGNVGTYENHALVIVNYGQATGDEVLEFAMRLKEEVWNKYGISLQSEVNLLN